MPDSIRRILSAATIAATMATALTLLADTSEYESAIGMNATIEEIILPGTELEVKPLQEDQPIVLRITKAFRHGSDYRYHLSYYGLEAGTYDLSEYLKRKDGSEIGQLRPIKVTVSGVLPPGQVKPNALTNSKTPRIGGYRLLLAAGVVIWIVGLVLLIRANSTRRTVPHDPTDESPQSLADRLRPLVESAANGSISDSDRADLERLLIVYWRDRLDLHDQSPVEAMKAIKNDPDAGELMRQLEIWLHHPTPDPSIDVAALLNPYRSIVSADHAGSKGRPLDAS